MIQKTEKTIGVETFIPSYSRKKIIEYKCSDGKTFTNENDRPGNRSGEQMAEEHEAGLTEIKAVKELILFKSINSRVQEEYEIEFVFYFRHDLPEKTLRMLHEIVYDFDHSKISEMKEGWYHVEQYVSEEQNNCSMCVRYCCDGAVSYLPDLIEEKTKELELLKSYNI